MFARSALRSSRAPARQFSTTISRAGHHPDGPYSNLPFQVHNRKYIPFGVLHWGFFGLGMGIPVFLVWYNLKKSGNL